MRHTRPIALLRSRPRYVAQFCCNAEEILRRASGRAYTTSTSRALSHAIKELETIQAARKAREDFAASTDAELAKSPAKVNQGQPEKQGENPASGDSRAFEDPEDGVGKNEAA